MEDLELERWKSRRDMVENTKFLLFIFLIYAIINGIGIMRFDIEGMHTFLKCFNGVVMFGILFIFMALGKFEYNIKEYGSLFKPKTNNRCNNNGN